MPRIPGDKGDASIEEEKKSDQESCKLSFFHSSTIPFGLKSVALVVLVLVVDSILRFRLDSMESKLDGLEPLRVDKLVWFSNFLLKDGEAGACAADPCRKDGSHKVYGMVG